MITARTIIFFNSRTLPTPQLPATEKGLILLAPLIRTHFSLDSHHIRFNVVDADALRRAKAEPNNYCDLIVRVAGYSDYFCDLSDSLQNAIIERTEHQSV